MKKYFIILPIIICSTISNLLAEGETNIPKITKSLSLEDCLKIASENNRQVLIMNEAGNQAEGKITEAKAGRYPSVSTTLNYTRIDQLQSFSMGGPKITTGSLDNYKAELSVRQSLYTGGIISSGIKTAELGQLIHKTQKEDLLRNLNFQIKKAYYDVLLDEETVKVNLKTEEASFAHLDDVTKQHKQGLVSNYDLLRAKVQLSNVRTMLIQSQSILKISKLFLINLIGLPLDSADILTLSDKLVYTSQISNLKSQIPNYNNRPDLRAAQIKMDIQRETLKMAKAENIPSFSLVGSYGEEKPSRYTMGSIEWGNYWNISAIISVPIFEGFRISAKIRQETSALQQAELAELDLRERINLELQQVIINIKDSIELIASQKENVAQAEEGLRLVEIGYKNGVNTQLEVMDTQIALDTASKNYIQAVYLYNIAQAALESVIAK
ncbi:MAG: TolC family protein [Planctomycetota bacterium]